MPERSESEAQGLTRRELLRKGAVLGGALAWSIPTVQTFRMAPAFAAATSHAISYVAMVLKCGDKYYRAKYEVGGSWSDGGSLPCGPKSKQSWPKEYEPYSALTEVLPLPKPSTSGNGSLSFDFRSSGCSVVWSISKCATICQPGPTGASVTFDACKSNR
jgi:hypothetical protein